MDNSEVQISERLYPNEFPENGDIVMVKIIKIDENSVTVHLLEYDREGMVPFKELSRKRVRNIRQFVRVGAQECMEVIDVDPVKGYIDLSRKQIDDKEKELCTAQYVAARRIQSYFYRWSHQSGENLVEKILWRYFIPEEVIPYSEVNKNASVWFEELPGGFKERMIEDFNKIFEKKAEKHEINIEMACYSLEGVRAIQEAIDKAMVYSTDEIPFQCIYTGKTGKFGNLIQLSTVTKSDDADTVLQNAVETMQSSLAQYRSRFAVVT